MPGVAYYDSFLPCHQIPGIFPEDGSPTIVVPETNGTYPVVDVSMSATAPGGFGIALEHGVGTVTSARSGAVVPAFAFAFSAADPAWTTLSYNVLALEPSALDVFFVYCEAGRVSAVWSESTRTALGFSAASGSCVRGSGLESHDAPVRLAPAEISFGRLPQGLAVSGDLAISGARAGTLLVDGTPWTLVPFAAVDCTTGCGFGEPGWYELHAVFWPPDGSRACFGIVYLYDGAAPFIAYEICVPDLGPPPTGPLDASWSGTCLAGAP